MMQQHNEYQGPLAGLNVIDFGHYYAGPMAAMLLADQGANVIRIVRPGDKELPEQQYRLLNRNKKLLTLDLKTEEGKAQALSVIEKADVLIENFRPGVMNRLGLDYASVKETNPALIYLSLPGFASTDKERANIQAWEGVMGAAAGVYTRTNETRKILGYPPVYSAVPQCSAYGSMHGAMAVMAALLAREEQGCGAVIEVPLVGAALRDMPGVGMLANLDGTVPEQRDTPVAFQPFIYSPTDSEAVQWQKLEQGRLAVYQGGFLDVRPFMGATYPCKDGRKVFLLCYDHRTFIERLFKGLGIAKQVKQEGFVNEGWYAPDDCGNNVSFRIKLTEERVQRLTQLIADVLLTKTAAQWDDLLGPLLPLGLMRTRQEWLTLQPMLASGVLATMDNGSSTLTVPGRVTSLTGPGDAIIDPTRFKEAHSVSTADVNALLKPLPSSGTQQSLSSLKKGDLLKGLKVLDLANVLAGPTATHALAEFGADVIKADPSRPSSTSNYYALIPGWISLSHGKRNILIDMKTAPGQGVLRRLIKWADVVIHNILDDQAERLGVGPDQIRAINPKAIGCQISAYGGAQRGGWENRPGYDWQAQAVSGLMTQFGSPEHPFLHHLSIAADTMGGLTLAFTSLLGVYQQRKTGWAGEARTSLVNAVNYFQLPWMIAENGCSDWGESRGQFALGDHWWQRFYQCNDGWIYVGTHQDRAAVLAETVTGQSQALEQALEAAFAGQSRDYWQAKLAAVDVGCHPVLTLEEPIDPATVRRVNNQPAHETASEADKVLRWEDHPCGQPVNLRPADHVVIGEDRSYFRQAPAPYLGQNTREILAELGYSENEINKLIRLNVAHEHLAELGGKGNYFYQLEA